MIEIIVFEEAIYWFVGERVASKFENWKYRFIRNRLAPCVLRFEYYSKLWYLFFIYLKFPYSVLLNPNIIITFRPLLSIHSRLQNYNKYIYLKACDYVVFRVLEHLENAWNLAPQPPFSLSGSSTKSEDFQLYHIINFAIVFDYSGWVWMVLVPLPKPNTKCVLINSYFGFSNTFDCVAFIFTPFVRFRFLENIILINHWTYIILISDCFGCFGCFACAVDTHTLILVSFTFVEIKSNKSCQIEYYHYYYQSEWVTSWLRFSFLGILLFKWNGKCLVGTPNPLKNYSSLYYLFM